MTRRRSFPWLPLALVVLCAGLAWLALQRLQAAPAERAAQSAVAEAEASALPATPTFTMPPATRYAEISRRPLFTKGRRPPELASEPSVEVAVVDLGVTLQGIVVAGPNRIAIFKDLSTGEVLRLKRNDRFKGWQLSQVGGDGVVFSNDDQEQRFELDYEQAPPAQPNRTRNNRRATVQRQQNSGE